MHSKEFIFFWILIVLCSANKFYPESKIISTRNAVIKSALTYSPLADSIAFATEIALKNCQKQFKWDRWNCPANDFISKRTAQYLDRETSFVQAINIAALIYTITKNCSRGELLGCGCDLKKIKEDNNWHWSGCSDHVDFGERVAEQVLEKSSQQISLDALGYAELHNSRAGRIAVRNSLRKHCRCHGLSGSCSLQTCWMSMNTFPEIAADIRKMYDNALLLKVDNKNNGNVATDIKEESLVYMFVSPNYCQKNVIPGWNGMQGRQCSRNKSDGITINERRSCKHLCKSCGHRIRKQQITLSTRCNCKFNWCCNVTCDICTDTIDSYFCE